MFSYSSCVFAAKRSPYGGLVKMKIASSSSFVISTLGVDESLDFIISFGAGEIVFDGLLIELCPQPIWCLVKRIYSKHHTLVAKSLQLFEVEY